MADEEEKDSTSSHGADWEVVALTASTYAAAPGPDADPTDDSRDKELQQEQESSNTMFMSQHFLFPPHEHENLPIEADFGEIRDQTESNGLLHAVKENICLDEFNEDSSEDELSSHRMESPEGETDSLFAETDSRKTSPPDDENDISETYDSAKLGKSSDENGASGLPSEAWWKRRVMSLYKQANETNTFWSIFIAAAFMGLLVLGQQWQREKLQLQQLRWRFSNTNERMSRLLGSVNWFKVAFVGGHQHSSLIHGAGRAAAAADI